MGGRWRDWPPGVSSESIAPTQLFLDLPGWASNPHGQQIYHKTPAGEWDERGLGQLMVEWSGVLVCVDDLVGSVLSGRNTLSSERRIEPVSPGKNIGWPKFAY